MQKVGIYADCRTNYNMQKKTINAKVAKATKKHIRCDKWKCNKCWASPRRWKGGERPSTFCPKAQKPPPPLYTFCPKAQKLPSPPYTFCPKAQKLTPPPPFHLLAEAQREVSFWALGQKA